MGRLVGDAFDGGHVHLGECTSGKEFWSSGVDGMNGMKLIWVGSSSWRYW